MISIIVAIAEDNGIGYNNNLLWHLPGDLKRFRKLTIGKTVVMGKKTWESLPKKPLAGRKNVVITDNLNESFKNCVTAYSLEDARKKCEGDDEVFIIGGGSIYRQFLDIADRLYITHIHKKTQADIYFPAIDPEVWEPVEIEEHPEDHNNPIPYSYIVYQRRNN